MIAQRRDRASGARRAGRGFSRRRHPDRYQSRASRARFQANQARAHRLRRCPQHAPRICLKFRQASRATKKILLGSVLGLESCRRPINFHSAYGVDRESGVGLSRIHLVHICRQRSSIKNFQQLIFPPDPLGETLTLLDTQNVVLAPRPQSWGLAIAESRMNLKQLFID